MGYACPVCDEHVPDAEHLADHLAFAAVTGDETHESWLDGHAPGWEEGGTDDLAPRVTEYAEEIEFEVDTHPVEGHSHEHGGRGGTDGGAGAGVGSLDTEAQHIVEEAVEMTREMQRDADGTEASRDERTDESEDETE